MVHDGSTDILAVNGLLLSFTWHTLHSIQHCYTDVSAHVPDVIRIAYNYRQNNSGRAQGNLLASLD